MSPLYMLDTNMVSHIIKGTYPGVQKHLLNTPMDHICISAVTLGELRYGLAKRPDATRLHALVQAFLVRIDVLPWDSHVANCYGDLRASMERVGKPLGNLDMMIAAHAKATNVALISNDQAFRQIKGLHTLDWTKD
ncbi:putative nucleic acid-binding protein, contains PIN domain [Pseudomonas sp. StFLB209]|uniref:type II toxin-antitoxin system VapC family toxin n=1 Tax=Pseudomonas sp. StFLB209 TaxID=1028989 RepID=UPI0004F8F060|nr:type II toxin-antitoxin system VapC family toxin [Pseudomonas sp. StFLB209]BAP45988.1 putative nucleic acid-binding protein, contains PIN domain [Pseudomonas sp. StFLB209]